VGNSEIYAVILLFVLATFALVAGCQNAAPADRQLIPGTTRPILITTPAPQIRDNFSSVPLCRFQDNRTFTITKGYPFTFNQTVPDRDISEVRIWMFGNNTYWETDLPVRPNGSIAVNFSERQTSVLPGYQHRIIFQYPYQKNQFSITARIDEDHEEVHGPLGGVIIDLRRIREGKMNGLDAADILENAIWHSGSGNTSENITFFTLTPVIYVDPVSDHQVGDIFTVNGSTDLEAGEKINILIDPAWKPLKAHYPAFEGSTVVYAGFCGNNSWSVKVNLSGLPPITTWGGGYSFAAFSDNPNLGAYGYASFNITAAQEQTTTSPPSQGQVDTVKTTLQVLK